MGSSAGGESVSPSTPFVESVAGSGALRQAWKKRGISHIIISDKTMTECVQWWSSVAKSVAQGHTWMRFFPSAFVTNGWSFGVVKV